MFKSCSSPQKLKTSCFMCMVTSMSAKMRAAFCVRSFLAEDGRLLRESPSLGVGQCQVQTRGQIIIIIIKLLQRKSRILWLWDHGRYECNFCSISLVSPWNSPGSGMHEAFWLTDLLCFWLKKKKWNLKKYVYGACILRSFYLILAGQAAVWTIENIFLNCFQKAFANTPK